jgi:5-methylcytosine-specific restriction protein A
MRERRPYDYPVWRTLRSAVLTRDHHTCQVRGPKCQTVATQVDHVMPWRQGGSWFDPTNLRAACSHCNNSRAHKKMARQ